MRSLVMVALAAAAAHAEPAAWKAASGRLPPDPSVVASADVKDLIESTAAKGYLGMAQGMPDVKKALDDLASLCLDLDAIDSAAYLGTGSGGHDGILFIAPRGRDADGLFDCAAKRGRVKLGARDADGIVAVEGLGRAAFHVAVVAKDVVAVAIPDPTRRDLLKTRLGWSGMDRKALMREPLGKVQRGATLWAALIGGGTPPVPMHGHVILRGDAFSFGLTMKFATEAEAIKAEAGMREGMADAKAKAPFPIPADMTVVRKGREVTMSAR